MKYLVKGYQSYNNGKKALKLKQVIDINDVEAYIKQEEETLWESGMKQVGLCTTSIIKNGELDYTINLEPAMMFAKSVQRTYKLSAIN